MVGSKLEAEGTHCALNSKQYFNLKEELLIYWSIYYD
tara:strand:+ start:152 stop:262 length:111 start_codon:yes stop_codon:yes gene_type:complete